MGATGSSAALRALPPFAEEEYDVVSRSICDRIRAGTLPPDDAYWWTRALVADPVFAMRYTAAGANEQGWRLGCAAG